MRLSRTPVCMCVAAAAVLLLLAAHPLPSSEQPGLEELRRKYQSASSQLQKHLAFDFWIDDQPESPQLLAQQWRLAGEWVAAWLDAHPSQGAEGVKAALADLGPGTQPNYLALSKDVYLVVAPSSTGNAFIVTKSDGHYRLAWSTADAQEARGTQADILAAWRPENARHGRRGGYWAASGSAGPVTPRLGLLPNDAEGHPRFYIDGYYAQSAGGTAGGQISLWIWDGRTARPVIVRAFYFMIDQAVGTRLEGDLLKVQEKKSFRTFSSCGQCEERQTDWIVRMTPHGIEDLGEKSIVPELDAVDELLYRVIHNRPAADVAAPEVIKAAEKMVEEVRAASSEKEWKEYPTLGMIGAWKVQANANSETLCLGLIFARSNVFAIKSIGEKLFITDMKETKQSCEE